VQRSCSLEALPVFAVDRVEVERNHAGHEDGGENDVESDEHVGPFVVVC
jgi:hypothetical protein